MATETQQRQRMPGGEADLLVQDPWRNLGRRYKEVERGNELPEITINRPGPDTQGFYNRLARTLDISKAATSVAQVKARNAEERRKLEEAQYLQRNWGSIDLSSVDPKFLKQMGISYEDIVGRQGGGKSGTPYGRPLRGNYGVTSPYKGGYRSSGGHSGVDFGAPAGTPIYATHNGVVGSAGYSGAYGNMVKLNGAGGMSTWYAHQSRMTVRAGQRVSKGQIIGYVGSTGNSSGNHLHYEVRVNGQMVNPSRYY